MGEAAAGQVDDRRVSRVLEAVAVAVSIAEASELTGLSKKALARRIERGSLPAVTRDGRRMIPRSELERRGLLTTPGRGDSGQGLPRGIPAGESSALVRELRETAEQLGRYKVLAERAESLERQAATERAARETAEAEVYRLRAELEALRQRPWRPWRRRVRPD